MKKLLILIVFIAFMVNAYGQSGITRRPNRYPVFVEYCSGCYSGNESGVLWIGDTIYIDTAWAVMIGDSVAWRIDGDKVYLKPGYNYVGIGVTNPSVELDIVGDVDVDGVIEVTDTALGTTNEFGVSLINPQMQP